VSFGFFSQTARADFTGGLNITFMPSYPLPGSRVSAGINTYSFDMNRARYVWQIDGKTVSDGNERYVSFDAPAFGKEKEISVFATAADGGKYVQTVTMRGNDVDLLWESLSSAPAWYRGKVLPVPDSMVKVIAVPYLFSGGALLKSSDLTYEWSLNGKKRLTESGVGRDFFVFFVNGYDESLINLTVSNSANDTVVGKVFNFKVENNKPKVLFYEDNPLEGIKYNQALSENFLLTQGEAGIRAEPFYFSGPEKLSYEWIMNSKKISGDVLPNVISVRTREGGESGTALLELSVKNPIQYIQSAMASLRISF